MKAPSRHFQKVLLHSFILMLGLLSFSSCQKMTKPSFIVLASDRLSFNSYSCGEDRGNLHSGFNTLCQESIRYTNTYSTSTQSAASLASLLTGRYPYEHGIHRNQDRVHAELPQVQEIFKANGYRTAFFSANPNVMRRTGLARGFDLFEDSSFLNQSSYTTRLAEQTKQLENWVDESRDPFFSLIYNSDLETLNGEEPNLSKVENFDEKLNQFILFLKKNKLWEQNYIVVVGLQGRSEYERLGETPYSNLHSENMNVAFFIKPPRQKGDEGINLKVDNLRTLADIGFSLIKMIRPEFKTAANDQFSTVDDSALWTRSDFNSTIGLGEAGVRNILFEAVNTWSSAPELRFALLNGHNLHIENQTDQIYNRLNDGLETIDTASSSPELLSQNSALFAILREKAGAKKWTDFKPEASKWSDSNRRYWFQSAERDVIFEKEKNRLTHEKAAQPLSTLLIYYLNSKKEKDTLYEEARRASYNVALENIWGLWDPKKKWPLP